MNSRFRPAMSADAPALPGEGRGWARHVGGISVLEQYARSLLVPSFDVRAEEIKSLPSPWARLLIFEQALFSDSHPAHRQLVGEWRGLLGTIALSHYMGLKIKATPIVLGRSEEGVLQDLFAMKPERERPEAWNRLALLSIVSDDDEYFLGATSPRTLVFTGSRRLDAPLPFLVDGRLTDPTEYYGQCGDTSILVLLESWISQTLEQCRNSREFHDFLGSTASSDTGVSVRRAERILDHLTKWKKDTEAKLKELASLSTPPSIQARLSSPIIQGAFPDQELTAKAYGLLCPLDAAEERRTVGLAVRGAPVRLVVNPGRTGTIYKDGHPFTGYLPLPKGQTRRVEEGKLVVPVAREHLEAGGTVLDIEDNFEPKLLAVRDVQRDRCHVLRVNDRDYLVPLKPDLLYALGRDMLADCLSAFPDPSHNAIRVRLSIPLEGEGERAIRFDKAYGPADVLDPPHVPDLVFWPDFVADNWNNYFFFLRHPAIDKSGTLLDFVPLDSQGRAPSFPQFSPPPGRVRWGQLSRPPAAWQAIYGEYRGLLIVKNPMPLDEIREEWEVSVDFGSTHTRAFRKTYGPRGSPEIHPVSFRPRAVYLIGELQAAVLHSFFPEQPRQELDNQLELPSQCILPTEGRATLEHIASWLPADGIMFWASLLNEVPPGLHSNLKWRAEESADQKAFASFLYHLVLALSAEARAGGAKLKTVSTAVPSVLPRWLIQRHASHWNRLADEFGFTHQGPRPEAGALAAFLADRGAPLAGVVVALDIGGSTSDLALWSKNSPQHLESVYLAGGLLSRICSLNAKYQEAINRALQTLPSRYWKPIPWQSTHPDHNALLFEALLRDFSKKGVPTLTLAQYLDEGPGSVGRRFVGYAAFLFASLSYFLGRMTREFIPDHLSGPIQLYFCGKGSGFLPWLQIFAEDAQRDIPTTFFLRGLGHSLDPDAVTVTCEDHLAKEEVGRGLLAEAVAALPAIPSEDERRSIIGETGFQGNGKELAFADELTQQVLKNIVPPTKPLPTTERKELLQFLETFDASKATKAVADALGLSGINESKLSLQIHNTLFGPTSSWNKARQGDSQRVLIEPFFFAEVKTVLMQIDACEGLFGQPG